jgi:zinc/manganese transport system permease protein
MVGPPAAARIVTSRPLRALALSVVFSVITLWAAVASSYWTNLPIGFFVGTMSAGVYLVARGWSLAQSRRPRGALA